jgi:trk system potassium uptake protein TrkA
MLEEAGARSVDVVIALGEHDPDNLIACQTAAHGFGVPRVIALAHDPDNVEVFEKLGVSAFSTTRIIGNLIEQQASWEGITNLLPVVQGRVNVTEIVLEEGSPAAGRLLRDVTLPEDSLIAVVERDKKPIVPRGNSSLRLGDRLVVITLPGNHAQVLRVLTGDRA